MDYGTGSAEHIKTPTSNSAAGRWLILATVTVATGLAAGLGGMVLGLLLHFVQHVTYGYSLHSIVSHESFLQGVSASSPVRRFWGAHHDDVPRPVRSEASLLQLIGTSLRNNEFHQKETAKTDARAHRSFHGGNQCKWAW